MNETIDDLIHRLQNESRNQSVNYSDTWRRYENSINAMSPEQRNWVCKQDSVLRAKSEVYASFIDYLFNANREAFISVGDGNNKKVCEKYIDEIEKVATSFVSRSELLEQQNRELAERNEELQKKLNQILGMKNESTTTSRGGRERESNSENIIQSRNDSEQNRSDIDLFTNQSE
ncbi:MAG: hypothetical protein KBT03_03240 [Bacteroidales bacterium]|nr:hypothetical protein [Candidatus Scybalousia scybalohippi]